MIVVEIPVKTHSQNSYHAGFSHWIVRKKIVDEQRAITRAYTLNTKGWVKPDLPIIITLTRLSSGELDDDNLPSSMKSIRDELAKILGVDDGVRDKQRRITWRYEQEKAKRGTYGVRVKIEPRAVANA